MALTESVDLFGQTNSADLILNDIWIEPRNPKEGDIISIHGTVYNAGVVATRDVADVVTIGYIVNGELLEINQIENTLPGIENGIEVSSGNIFTATPGEHTVTVIINFHDTLSHLRDNPENNIIQKKFQFTNEIPSQIKYNILQKYQQDSNNQNVTIHGELSNILEEKIANKKISIEIEKKQEIVTTDKKGEFTIDANIPFNDKPIDV